MPTGDARRRRLTPEIAATVVNAGLVLFLPLLLTAFLALFPDRTHSYAIGHAPGWSPWRAALQDFVLYVSVMAPFTAIAAWRTWVHATRWRNGEHTWQGIAEAGLLGFAIAAIPLLIATVTRMFTNPSITPPFVVAWFYALFYGLFGLVIGLGVGGLLQLSAMVVLTIAEFVTD